MLARNRKPLSRAMTPTRAVAVLCRQICIGSALLSAGQSTVTYDRMTCMRQRLLTWLNAATAIPSCAILLQQTGRLI